MRCLRRAVNKTRRDTIRNEHTREMVGTTPAQHYIQQHQPTTTYNNTSPPLHTTTPAQHYIQQHQPTTTYNNTSPTLHTTTPAQHYIQQQRIKWFGHLTHGHQPTGPQGIQHQDGRLQSERETKKNWDCRCQRDTQDIRHPPLQALWLAADRQLHLPATLPGTIGRIK